MARIPKKPVKPKAARSERPDQATQFQPGQSGNPAGRRKGSRNLLGELFLSDLLADFEQHGKAVLARVRQEKPQDYVKVVAAILPKEVKISNDTDALTDEQIAARIRHLAAELGFAIGEADGDDGTAGGAADPKGYH